MNARIKQLRKYLGYTQEEFGDCLGVSSRTIAAYGSGKNKPIKPVLILICREFNICEDWLLSGTGEMFLSGEESALDILARRYHLRVDEVTEQLSKRGYYKG